MSKTKKSKLLASMLCATVVAGLYAGPVMAAQSGLTVGSGSSAQSVTAANFVTINGVNLTGNRVEATSLVLGSTALSETNLKNVNSIFSTAAGVKPVINVGGINVKDDAGATNFSVSKTGAVTAKGGATISATNGTTGANGKTAVSYSGVTDTVTGSNVNQQVTSSVTASSVTDTIYKDKDGIKTRAAVSTVGDTGISDTLYNDNGTTSKMTLSAASSQLASGTANFTAYNNGAVAMTGTNFTLDTRGNLTTKGGAIYVKDTAGKTNFSVSNAGAVTANGGIISNKTTVTGTEFNGTDNFNSAKNTLESAGFATTKMVGNSTLGYTDGKYTTIDGQKIDIFNGGVANVGGNNNYSTAVKQNQKYTTSKGTVTSNESGLSVFTSQKTEEVKVTETFEKENVEAEYSTPQANGATMGNVNINKDGGTTTYKVTHTTTDITNNFSNTSANGLSFSKTSSQKKEEFVQTADTSLGSIGELNGTTSYTQTDTTNNMSQNNGAFSMSGTVQNNTFASQDDFESGKFADGTKTSNSIAGSNGSVSMTASKDYIDYTDGIAAGDVGYNQAANKTTVSSSIKVNSASGTGADDASGSITLSNSKVNYEYGPYDKFGKPSTTTAVNEYSTTATVGKGDFSVSGNRYGKDEGNKGKVVGAGSMYVNSESYGTRLSQSNYEYDEAGNQIIKSATISLNNGAVAISGTESASLKAGSYGFATTKDGINTITGKNFAVAANGTLTLNNGTNNTLYVDASGNLTNTASNGTSTSKVTNNYNGLTTTVTDSNKTVSSSTTLNYGIKDSFTDADGNVHSVTTNGNGTTFSATGTNGTGSTIINGNTIITGTIKAGNTTINNSGLIVGSTTISSGTITTGTLNVDTINLGNKIVDKDGNPVYDLTISADGSANFAHGNFKVTKDGAVTNKVSNGVAETTFATSATTGSLIHKEDGKQTAGVTVGASGATLAGNTSTYVKANNDGTIAINSSNFKVSANGAITDTIAYSNTNGDYTGKFTTNYNSNTLSNKLVKADGTSQETALTTGYGSGSLIHKENGTQTAGITVGAAGAMLAGNTSTYVKANADGTIAINSSNFKVSSSGTVTVAGDVRTGDYSLNTIGNKTAGINRYVNENSDGYKHVTSIENGVLTVTDEVTYPEFGPSEITNKLVSVNGNLNVTGTVNGISIVKDDEGIKLDDINVTELNEWVQENQGTVSGLGERVDKLENKTGGIERTVKTENGVKTSTTSIENGALTIEATEPTTEPGFAGTVKVGVHGDLAVNGNLTVGESFKVDANGNLTTTGTFNGNTITEGAFNGVAINMADGKAVINGVSMGMEGNNAIINGVNINDLETTVGDIVDADIPDKVEGIERDGNDTTGYTTTIEESFKVHSTDGYDVGTIDVYGSMIQSNNADGGKGVLNGDTLTLTGTGYGNITTISGGNITTNTINGVNFSDWYNKVNDNLEDLNDKTQNITGSGETGNVGEGGNQIEVPPTTGGETGINGDVTVGGNLTAGSGTIGDVTMEDGKVTAGSATIGDVQVSGILNVADKVTADKDGVTVAGKDGNKVVIDGNDVSVTDKDGNTESIMGNAAAIDNIEQGMASMSNRISKVEDRIDKVGAMSAAIANLRTMGYDPTAPTEIAVGIGQYRSETGAALGLFHYPNRDFMLSLSVSTSGDEVMGGIGATWKFGRKTPEQMLAAEKEKAAKAKLAKAEAMKKAAAEAKVAEQQAKHAKMAAEKAAK